MKRIIIAFLLINTLLSVCAQEFNTPWIYAPQSDSTSHVWFRHLYLSNGRPRQATITVTSTGYYKLYVNECNIGTALFNPYRGEGDTTAIQTTFDISPYLRPDSNVVALLYSPVFPRVTHRQIAANIYGKNRNDSAFSYTTDESWLCRRANSSITPDGGELIDGLSHDPSWKAATIYNLALWKHAESDKVQEKIIPIHSTNNAFYISRSTSYNTTEFTQTEDSYPSLELPFGFYGFVRATIREAKRGERILFGNMEYICNGKIDEQAYPQFSLGFKRAIPIIGDNKFSISQIMSIDVLNVAQQR